MKLTKAQSQLPNEEHPRPNAFAFDDDGNVLVSTYIEGPLYLDEVTGVIRSTPVERGKK